MFRVLIAAVFFIAPSLAFAQGCQHGHGAKQMSLACDEGKTFDPDTGKCIDIVG